jgi:hypothetical protein
MQTHTSTPGTSPRPFPVKRFACFIHGASNVNTAKRV